MAPIEDLPERIGRYRVLGPLGRGGFATVYRAHDDALDVPVAVKVLAEQWSLDPEVRSRFLQEARLLRRSRSDRLIGVHDVGQLADGRPYFVMDHADRGTLEERLQAVETGQVPPAAALQVAREVAAALMDVHHDGLVHRDIKPDNVLLRSRVPEEGRGEAAVDEPSARSLIRSDEQVLLSDFGLAKDLAMATTGLSLPIGTPGYMAPEQTDAAAPADQRADIYGCSALMVRMLSGEPPPPTWRGDPSTAVPHATTPALHGVLTRGLDPDPAQRQESIEAWLEAVETAIASDADTGSATAQRRRSDAGQDREVPPRRRWLVGGLAVAVTIAIASAVGAWWSNLGSPADYDRYERVADDTDSLSLSVPADWDHRVGNGWHPGFSPYNGEVGVGPGLNVAPNAWDWFEDATTPGAFVGASSQVIQETDETPESLARYFAPTGCRADTTDSFSSERLGVRGVEGSWTCDAGHEWYYVYASPPDRRYVLLVEVKLVDERDRAARDRLLATLEVVDEP